MTFHRKVKKKLRSKRLKLIPAQGDVLSRPTTALHVSFSWTRGRVTISRRGLYKVKGRGGSQTGHRG